MNDKIAITDDILVNAEIIFSEFYYYTSGHSCPPDIWNGALESWRNNTIDMPMVDAAISAALAIASGKVRSVVRS